MHDSKRNWDVKLTVILWAYTGWTLSTPYELLGGGVRSDKRRRCPWKVGRFAR